MDEKLSLIKLELKRLRYENVEILKALENLHNSVRFLKLFSSTSNNSNNASSSTINNISHSSSNTNNASTTNHHHHHHQQQHHNNQNQYKATNGEPADKEIHLSKNTQIKCVINDEKQLSKVNMSVSKSVCYSSDNKKSRVLLNNSKYLNMKKCSSISYNQKIRDRSKSKSKTEKSIIRNSLANNTNTLYGVNIVNTVGENNNANNGNVNPKAIVNNSNLYASKDKYQKYSKLTYNSIPESKLFERNLQIMKMKLNSIEQIRNSSKSNINSANNNNNPSQGHKICNEIFYI